MPLQENFGLLRVSQYNHYSESNLKIQFAVACSSFQLESQAWAPDVMSSGESGKYTYSIPVSRKTYSDLLYVLI